MTKTSQDCSQSQASINPCIPTSSNALISKAQEVKNHGSNLASLEHGWRSEDLKSKLVNEYDEEVRHIGRLRKSQSLGSGLHLEGRLYTDLTEGDTDPGLSYDGLKSHNESIISGCGKDQDQFHVSSGLANDGSIFSIGDLTPSDKDAQENCDTPLTGGYAGDSADHSGANTPTLMPKSCSLPNIVASTLYSRISSFEYASSKSRSSEDLHTLSMRLKHIHIDGSDDQVNGERAGENRMGKTEENHTDSSVNGGYDSYPLSGLAKDWVMPVIDDIYAVKTLDGESSVHRVDELPNEEFKIKRIEDWVTGLQHCGPVDETTKSSNIVDPLNGVVSTINSVTAVRVDGKVTPGMEAARRYVSSLSANATAAHLANYGLVVIPFLSAFVSLKVLNVSGNAIVRITARALPRGLHVLNLSKNNISIIEGLRELTRLRVLDLSHNRILRIGHGRGISGLHLKIIGLCINFHILIVDLRSIWLVSCLISSQIFKGLASCSSLKELYLAGNKIGEVEGLHRLLKLGILDLRFNKISTAKCLGQLAANFNSLQAISLEGNPAQKNVGNEQLKKYLQGLLPHLAYYNGQSIRVSSLKDAADRSVRLVINSHQLDRSPKSDHKTTRKGGHGIAARRPLTCPTHARGAVESPRQSKGRQGHLPPIRAKVATQSRHHFDVVGKLLNLRQGLSIRKSRSEGTIGAL